MAFMILKLPLNGQETIDYRGVWQTETPNDGRLILILKRNNLASYFWADNADPVHVLGALQREYDLDQERIAANSQERFVLTVDIAAARTVTCQEYCVDAKNPLNMVRAAAPPYPQTDRLSGTVRTPGPTQRAICGRKHLPLPVPARRNPLVSGIHLRWDLSR